MRSFSPRRHRLTRLSPPARLAVLLGSIALLLTGPAGPAQADTAVLNRNWGVFADINPGSGTTRWWLGSYGTAKGTAFCLHPSKLNSVGGTLSDPRPLTSFVNDEGETLTTAQLNQLAYLMWRAAVKPPTSNLDGIAYMLATMTLAGYDNARLYLGPGKLTAKSHSFSVDDPNSGGSYAAANYGVPGLTRDLVAEARAQANNWNGNGTLSLGNKTPQRPGDTLTASVSLPGLGNGFPVVFQITRPDGKTDTRTVKTSQDAANLTYETAGGYGEYKVSARLDQAVPPNLPQMIFSNNGTQSLLLTGGNTRTWEAARSFRLERPAPTIATQISSQVVLPGETIHDTVQLSSLVNDGLTTYFVSGGLYGLAPLGDWACPEATDKAWRTAEQLLEIAATAVVPEQIAADGSATITLGEWTVPDDQPVVCVSYGESLAMLVGGKPAQVVEHPQGSPSQTGLVLPAPTINTHISAPLLTPGAVASDTVTLGGLDITGQTSYSFSGSLLAVPLPTSGQCPTEGDPAWADGTTLATIDETVGHDLIDGGGAVLAGLGQWTAPGDRALCVTYTETLTLSLDGHAPVVVDHPAGHPAQTAQTVTLPVQPGGSPATETVTLLVQAGGSPTAPVPPLGSVLLAGGLLIAGAGIARSARIRRSA